MTLTTEVCPLSKIEFLIRQLHTTSTESKEVKIKLKELQQDLLRLKQTTKQACAQWTVK